MHTRRMLVAVVALCTLFVSILLLPDATASEGPREPAKRLTEVAIGATRVDWQPTADYERLVLTVAGPGDLFIQREVGAGEAPSFSSNDGPGGRLPDGIYAYELRAVPRSELRPGERLSEGSLVQWGHLWVREGSFVDKVAPQPRPSSQGESASKTPSNVTAHTTVPDDLIVEEDLIVKGHACIGNECEAASSAPLTIKDIFNYQILFDGLEIHPAERKWALQANDLSDPNGPNGDFLFRDLSAGTIPFRVGSQVPDNALTIGFNGNVGVGTLTPAKKLHVLGSNGTTQGLIEETNGTTALRTMLELKNKGASRLNITDSSTGATWGINNNGGNLNMLKSGTGVTAASLTGSGNLTIAGSLTQGSDRDTKRDIVSVQPEEILAKLMILPITTWNRKTDDPSVRHMGPMAQDFAATFGLGEDDRHIAILDIAGVSLASIQALSHQVAEVTAQKDEEIAQLRRENADLAQRLAAIEALILQNRREEGVETALKPAP